MTSVPDLLIEHGVAVVFAWAFVVQAGVPAPAIPMLLGAGALSGSGRMHVVLAVAAAMAATLSADVLWYSLGRSYGARALGMLSRFSLDPDSLIRHAKERFAAHRLRYVVLAKFLPGVNPLAAGLAGAVPIRLDRFLLTRRPVPCYGPEPGSRLAISARTSSVSLQQGRPEAKRPWSSSSPWGSLRTSFSST